MKIVSKFFCKIKNTGVLNTFCCLYKLLFLKIVSVLFRLERWHSIAPYECRAYKKLVVGIVNELQPHTVVEIGCGLGEIISRVNAAGKHGFDREENVIKVAKMLCSIENNFHVGSFDEVKSLKEKIIDVLIMVNWLHDLDGSHIRGEIEEILKVKEIKYIIVDEVHTFREGYRYHHDFEQCFHGIAEKIKDVDDGYDNYRKISLFKIS
ncbi:MAG: class I SAM-dependent methyltransferase [Nitrospinae bacterium]|nr:class I SAM-dependent methyltransferase [Nitrospinota bacterium]